MNRPCHFTAEHGAIEIVVTVARVVVAQHSHAALQGDAPGLERRSRGVAALLRRRDGREQGEQEKGGDKVFHGNPVHSFKAVVYLASV